MDNFRTDQVQSRDLGAREVDHSPRQKVDHGSGQAGSVVGYKGAAAGES